MFSPATRKKSNYSALKDRNLGSGVNSSPATPAGDKRPISHDNQILNRPITGTPAPWSSRSSVLARITSPSKTEKIDDKDPVKPVYVGEYPQVVRDEQNCLLQKHVPGQAGQACRAGGMDEGTSLAWVICGSKLFIWSYLSPAASNKCVVLDLPSDVAEIVNNYNVSYVSNSWIVNFISWDNLQRSSDMQRQPTSTGVVLCNQRRRSIIYWPDIYSSGVAAPVTSLATPDELEVASSDGHGRSPQSKLRRQGGVESLAESNLFNSFIATVVSYSDYVCIALASSSDGQLWQFHCSPSGILRKKIDHGIIISNTMVTENGQPTGSKGYPRSLVWRASSPANKISERQFFLLTAHKIHCFNIQLSSNLHVEKLWSHEIIGTDSELGIKKDLAGQKRVWPLDMQVDDHGNELVILVATFCNDRASTSSYTQYSLLTMQYKSEFKSLKPMDLTNERVLEKKGPVQVIMPKARVEEEEFLFSMRLRVGGKPSGSAFILSGDGTATISYYWGSSTRLYQFDLPYDAGKVLDASTFPSMDDREGGAWVVLTEKAGVWAIPEKAVLLGGVEPPERSLSRKGSSKEGNAADGKTSSGTWDAGDRQRAAFSGISHRTAQDEETEALVSHLFHDFLLSGQVDSSLDKLKSSGAFEREGEMNAFARMSKSIVDTLAKHWTTTRGAEIVALAAVSTQLVEKQQRHQKLLQFLALSKCHEELCWNQRYTLQIIMEHGEKLASMIQLRELQNLISQRRLAGNNSQFSGLEREASGALWDLIQIVGERARRNTVLLMDRDNAEVFYSKVSDIEEFFYCLDKLDYIITVEQPFKVQVQRACELSNACVIIVRSAIQYKSENHMWYPPFDGLIPWYSQKVVRNGLWRIAAFLIHLLTECEIDLHAKSDICSHLEVLADIVLEAYVCAISAKVERGEEHRVILEEYWNRRDSLFDSLYQQIKIFAEAGVQGTVEMSKEPDMILRKLSSNLLSVARRHEGYKTLWHICSDLGDTTLLKNLMKESVGPKGGFSYFVFEQLYNNGQYSKLLRLGEEFPEELATFLKDHLDLRWLHEIYLHQFSSASKTLHVLSLSEDEVLASHREEGTQPICAEAELTLPARKRLLYLSKIASLAGKDPDYVTEVERIDADIKILKLQEDILRLFPDDEEKQKIGQRLLPPRDLIRLCLKGSTPGLALKAFDVFAWTSSSFRKGNRTLLEECWKNAVDLEDWEKLYQFSVAEGWSDEDALKVLEGTVLFQASRQCYGPQSESYDGGFDDVLPLRQENQGMTDVKDSGSVEAILMQHKDFSDAGKLMLTAIMLGSAQVDIGIGDGLAPME